jgi:tetratricopeptide (TPR) repeat protein
MREFEIILKRDPSNYPASLALAELYGWDRRYYGRSLDLYARLAREYPGQIDPILEMGRMYYERGELADAEVAYRRAIELQPSEIEPRMAMARVYFGMNRVAEARREFETVASLQPENTEAHDYLARIYALEEATYDKAIREARLVLIAEPKNDETRLLLGKILRYRDQPAEAATELEKLATRQPVDPEALLELARAYVDAEEYENAIATFQRLVGIEPSNLDARIEFGVALTEAQRYGEAIDVLTKALQAAPWDVRARRYVARAHDASRDAAAAIDQYKRILLIDPADQEARTYLQSHGVDLVDQQSMLDSYYGGPRLAAAVSPPGTAPPEPPPQIARMSQEETAYRLRVAEEFAQAARYQRAIRQYEKLVRQEPDNAYYHVALGNVYRWSGYWRSATLEYQRALALEPQNAEARQGLAAIYRDSSPSAEAFLGHGMAMRFNDKVGYVLAGGRFIYRFWNNSLVSGEITARDFTQDDQDPIYLGAAKFMVEVGAALGLDLRAGYSFQLYDRVPATHNWQVGLTYNAFDYVVFSFDYIRRDVWETIPAIEEGIYQDLLRGLVELHPIERLKLWGEYEHGLWSKGDDRLKGTDNVSRLTMAGVSYLFLDNPSLSIGYNFSYVDFEEQRPQDLQVYWSPSWFMGHALPIELNHQPLDELFYFVGISPGIGRERGGSEWEWSIAAWTGMRWTITWQNELELTADASFQRDLWGYNLMLLYRHYFALKRHPLRPYYDDERMKDPSRRLP